MIVEDNVILKTIAEDIAVHLTALRNVFQIYFPRIVAENAQTALIRNSFLCEVGTVEKAIQEQLLEPYIINAILWSWRGFGCPFPFCI